MLLALLCAARAHRIEPYAVDGLARCWRTLEDEHGSTLNVSYACVEDAFCQLQIANCAPVSVWPDGNRTDGTVVTDVAPFTFTLEFHHNVSARSFQVLLRDHLDHGVFAKGTVGTLVHARKRHLRVHVGLKDLETQHELVWSGVSSTNMFGFRRDCTTEKCPSRWSNCWTSSTTDMMQISVFLVLHFSFCDAVPSCEEYVAGAFRDMNLVYENQLGVSLRLSFVLPPEAFKRHWGEISSNIAHFGKTDSSSEIIGEFSKIAKMDMEQYFHQVIGRSAKKFGIFHLMIAYSLSAKKSNKSLYGIALSSTFCKGQNNAMGWTTFRGHNTWSTMAHEIAHNLGASDFDKKFGSDPAGNGLMGYGNGKVLGMYAFHDKHQGEICGILQSAVRNTNCLAPYFGVPERDTRVILLDGFVLGQNLELLVGTLFLLVLVVCGCAVLIGSYMFSYKVMTKRRHILMSRCQKLKVELQSLHLPSKDVKTLLSKGRSRGVKKRPKFELLQKSKQATVKIK